MRVASAGLIYWVARFFLLGTKARILGLTDTFIYGDTVAVVMIFITLHTSSTILLSVFSELYKEVSHCELRLNRLRRKGPDGNHDMMLLGLITCW